MIRIYLLFLQDLEGRLLTVNKAAPRGTQPERAPRTFDQSFRVYVGNLPWDIDNGRLEQIFSEHGKVVSARIVYDRETGRSRGFGFVTFNSETEMNDAIAALDGQVSKKHFITLFVVSCISNLKCAKSSKVKRDHSILILASRLDLIRRTIL